MKLDRFNVYKIISAVLICFVIAFSFSVMATSDFGGTFGWNEIFDFVDLSNKRSDKLSFVRFVDVGEADCSIIYSNGEVAIIDSGSNSDDGAFIARYLRKNKITNIKYLIATHPHNDHIGGMPMILNFLEVENLIFAETETQSQVDRVASKNLLNSALENEVPIITPLVGQKFEVGDFSLQIICFLSDELDENDRSLVVLSECEGVKLIFTGDAGKPVEQYLVANGVDVSADVIKIAHHGSKYATNIRFLEEVNPKYALISCGLDNSYSHPSEDLLFRLNNKGVEVYRTDINGDVTFYVLEGEIKIETER